MKGLFIKDFMTIKKTLIYMYVSIFFILSFYILIYLSFQYGNFKVANDVVSKKNMVLFLNMLIALFFGQVSTITNIFEQDIKNDFSKVLLTFPLKDSTRTLEKFLFFIGTYLSNFTLGIIFVFTFGTFVGVTAINYTLKPFVLFMTLCLVIENIVIIFMYCWGTRAGTTIKLLITIILMFSLTICLDKCELETIMKYYRWFLDRTFLFFAAGLFIVLPASYALSLNIVKARRNKVW